MERVISYIDGFNLYFGLKSARLNRYLWLDLHNLSINLLKKPQQLVKVKYFTARITGPPINRNASPHILKRLKGFQTWKYITENIS